MDKQTTKQPRMIHLLYVPTLYCNLKCTYCYLDEKTNNINNNDEKVIETLEYAVNKFTSEDIIPFNISLHGGEVTTLRKDQLEGLFRFITGYYEKNKEILELNGFNKKEPHIKTNLFNFHKLEDLFKEYRVSVSASVDLPLSMHEKYRLTKNGKPTLERILANLKLLAAYPYKKKFSSVICYEHYLKTEEIIQDVWKIHREIGFDMNYFNFMFGFEVNSENNGNNTMLRTLTDVEQLNFYRRIRDEFSESELKEGFRERWFEEFTPSYCTNSANCGEKFFLLQYNGDIYSCVRGQADENFYFGNIYKDTVSQIMENAILKIKMRHNNAGFDENCRECNYLSLCKTGCPFVKYKQNISKSYTCELQKELYLNLPEVYKPFASKDDQKSFVELYKGENHPQLIFEEDAQVNLVLPSDFNESKNKLGEIIKSDPLLNEIYSPGSTIFEVNDRKFMLESQITKKNKQILIIKPGDKVSVYIKDSVFDINCREKVRNSLYLMLLRDTKVMYGDERRVKQEHVFTHQVFYNLLEHVCLQGVDYMHADLTELFHMYHKHFLEGILNNFFITASYARDYHYQKQKDNAFYHIQAINLPFSNMEFYWKG